MPPPTGLAGPAVGRAGGRRGAPLVFTHGETSKQLLEIDWDYPVYVPEEVESTGSTQAAPVRRALSIEEAMVSIAGDDRRPMLVLRECLQCQGTDLALLSREFANERTMLLTDWFHCVKIPANVSQADHPYHNLFPNHSHLFLATADGSVRVDFDGMQSQTSLWRAMGKMLRQSYDGSAETSVKGILKLLAQYDIVDEKEARLLKELDEELETRGAQSSRVRKLQEELKALGDQRADLLARERKLRELELKPLGAK
ncbi:MAG: hypothetical protein AB7O97_10375 [Planctomycetota bacterium]